MKYNELRIMEKEIEITRYILFNVRRIEEKIIQENKRSSNYYRIVITDIIFKHEEYFIKRNEIDIEYNFVDIQSGRVEMEDGEPIIYLSTFRPNFEELTLEHIIE